MFWKNSQITIKTNFNVFKSSIISGLLYRCGTWRTEAPDTFIINIINTTLKFSFLMKVS